MPVFKFIPKALWAMSLCAAFLAPAHAQTNTAVDFEANALEDVNAHPRHIGSFIVRPQLTLEEKFNDNVLASDSDKQADFITKISPALNIEKELGRHSINLNGTYDLYRYARTKNENISDYSAQIGGLFEGYHNLHFPLSLTYIKKHKARNQERQNINLSKEPTAIKQLLAEGGVIYQPNRFKTELMFRHEKRRYEDGISRASTAVVNRDSDFNQTEAEAVFSYETPRKWAPFISLLIEKTDFLRNNFDGTGFNGPKRDSINRRIGTGLTFDYKGILTGRLGGGYFWKNYESNEIENISAFSLDSEIVWKPTERATFSGLLLRRSIEDNDVIEGLVQTKAALNLDYELQRDLFFQSANSLIFEEFKPGPREDTIYENTLGLYYIINPTFQLGAGYTRRSRNSNAPDNEFDQNIFMIKLDSKL